tara:strand:- start:150 stop:1274 length:1125 start_codon:yes stop_codon:yes gene_type:complete
MAKKKGKKNKKRRNINNLPKVTICTPTFNRRPFIPGLIRCIENQQYPKYLLEWIVIDDGTDPIEDLIKHLSYVKYYYYDTKMSLGEKRNIMHSKSTGDILVYMDDDDYYPPTRVSHAVEKLQENKDILCAGCSTIHVWFQHINKMVQFGPYHENHATAGTFAFRRELLNICKYDDSSFLAEEKTFLKNYTIPIIQLEPEHVILCFSHRHNTFNKTKLLLNMDSSEFIKFSDKSPSHFIKEFIQKDFYLNKLDQILILYDKGLPIHKPDVLLHMLELEEGRRRLLEEELNKKEFIILKQSGKDDLKLDQDQVVNLLKTQHHKITTQKNLIDMLMEKNKDLEQNVLNQSVLISRLQLGCKIEPEPEKNITFEITEA